jgi:dTDP-L-rhamnose 4-epimerase
MKVCLIGSFGFIGTYVHRKLLDRGISAADIKLIDSLEPQVHGVKGHYPRAGMTAITQQFDVVIHLGAKVGVGQSMYEPVDYVACNSLDTAKLLHNLTGVKPKRLVVASSMSVYGEGAQDRDDLQGTYEPLPTPESKPPDLRSIYALTKFDQEQLSLIWGRANDVPTVALRFFNTYGPGQALTNPYTGALAIFATRILNGKAPVIYEDGQQTRDFIHVEDVAEAVVHAALGETKVPPGIYNVGTGVPQTLEHVARLLAEKLGADLPPVITGTKRAGDIRHCYADITKLKATGWAPRITFEQGITEYANWLRTQPVPEDRFDKAAQELEKAGLVR